FPQLRHTLLRFRTLSSYRGLFHLEGGFRAGDICRKVLRQLHESKLLVFRGSDSNIIKVNFVLEGLILLVRLRLEHLVLELGNLGVMVSNLSIKITILFLIGR